MGMFPRELRSQAVDQLRTFVRRSGDTWGFRPAVRGYAAAMCGKAQPFRTFGRRSRKQEGGCAALGYLGTVFDYVHSVGLEQACSLATDSD